MASDSIRAYDLPERVQSYDADMDVMHPLRWKMIEVALEVLPFHQVEPLRALDLGVGTGVFSKRFLEEYAAASVVAIDGANAMLELARSRLGELGNRVEWICADFRKLPVGVLKAGTFDVVLSSYSLHHLNAQDKLGVLKSVVRAVRPGGWLLNADLVVARDLEVEQRIQQIRVEGVTARAHPQDSRFRGLESTRSFLAGLEAAEQDQPLTLDEDLGILREAGLGTAEVFWKEYREAVTGGPKILTVL